MYQFLRNNRMFRALLRPLLAARRKLLFRKIDAYGHTLESVIVGGDIVLRPKNINGMFAIDATSHLAKRILQTGTFEPEVTSALLKLNPTFGDVINIGANVGLYAVFFSALKWVRTIYAIEPNPEASRRLKENIAHNNCLEKVRIFDVCVSAVPGEVELAVIPGHSEFSSITKIVHPSVSDQEQTMIRVPAMPLDSILSNEQALPSLIFVDTEGAELLIFQGAEKLLKRYKPILVFECEDHLLRKFGHSSAMLEEFLTGLGYKLRDLLDTKVSLQHPFVGEVIAIPAVE